MSVMSFDEAVYARRSVRAFRPQEVPEALIREALILAQRAPSNYNVQPWMPPIVSSTKLMKQREALLNAARTRRARLEEAVRFHR